EVAPLRAGEQQRACDIVGVSQLRFLDHPDGLLVSSLELRRDIARAVREVRPDLVVTANSDLEAYGGLTQADHRVAGRAARDRARASLGTSPRGPPPAARVPGPGSPARARPTDRRPPRPDPRQSRHRRAHPGGRRLTEGP